MSVGLAIQYLYVHQLHSHPVIAILLYPAVNQPFQVHKQIPVTQNAYTQDVAMCVPALLVA